MKRTILRWFAAFAALLGCIVPATVRAQTYTTVSGTFRNGYAQQVLTLVNQQRQAYGLRTLTMTQNLTDAAMKRAAELAVNFSHKRPNGDSCYTAFSGNTRAENIAYGQTSPAAVMNSWMNSQIHRDNILSSDIGFIGIGCFQSGNTLYWVQVFSDTTTSGTDNRSSNLSATVKVSKTSGVDSIVTITGTPEPAPSGTCTIRFNANGGSGSMANQTIAYNATAALRRNTFTRSGYVFRGWSRSPGGAVQYTDGQTLRNTDSDYWGFTLYAVWARQTTGGTCTIRFSANGGSGSMANQTIAYNATAKLRRNTFTRSGYVFRGWATSPGGAVRYSDQASLKNTSSGTRGVTLYAVWQRVSFTRPTATKGTYSGYIRLTWAANASAIYGYSVVRTPTAAFRNGVTLGTTTGRQWLDRTAQAGRQYWYWVCPIYKRTARASGGYQYSRFLPAAGTTANVYQRGFRFVSVPKANVSWGTSKTCVSVKWAASPQSWYGYRVYRGTSTNLASSTCIASVGRNVRSYVDRGAYPGRTYYYWIGVRGYNATFCTGTKRTAGYRSLVVPTTRVVQSGRYAYLSWNSVYGARVYRIYRNRTPTLSSATWVGNSITTHWTDHSVSRGCRYYWWMVPQDVEGDIYRRSNSYGTLLIR